MKIQQNPEQHNYEGTILFAVKSQKVNYLMNFHVLHIKFSELILSSDIYIS